MVSSTVRVAVPKLTGSSAVQDLPKMLVELMAVPKPTVPNGIQHVTRW
jgi:hypothetical protein